MRYAAADRVHDERAHQQRVAEVAPVHPNASKSSCRTHVAAPAAYAAAYPATRPGHRREGEAGKAVRQVLLGQQKRQHPVQVRAQVGELDVGRPARRTGRHGAPVDLDPRGGERRDPAGREIAPRIGEVPVEDERRTLWWTLRRHVTLLPVVYVRFYKRFV